MFPIFEGESLGGLSAHDSLSEPDESIFVEKLDKVDYDIAKERLIDHEKKIIEENIENAYVVTKKGEVYRFEGEKDDNRKANKTMA